ncbi:hypothetical protein PLICRDRAFT_114924 [Plicaturopsis crispa FD-325 SS-3]|nr:hypothetical protein PLICRDRAFT_114924 [Plicaturopsis crispa FD-325 SS-3]
MGEEEPSIWPDLRRLWLLLADAKWGAEDVDENALRGLCSALGRFTRNIVAGVPENQARAFENEPEIRRLIYYHTSWSAFEEEATFPVARTLSQTLSNLVTTNEGLMSNLWTTYMNLPEEQLVLVRLIASPDSRTVLSALVLVLNCIHGSKERAHMLSTTPIGARTCITILDRMVSVYEEEESSDGAKAFDLGYEIFTRLFQGKLTPKLYARLVIQDEIITPHQTTLLKLLDSYLQSTPEISPEQLEIHSGLNPMLSSQFFALSSYAQRAIERALASDPSSPATPTAASAQQPLQELDMILPKVCEALVLITQCIVTIALLLEDSSASIPSSAATVQDTLNEMRSPSGQGLVESLIELLRLLDIFLPRIKFGKPVTAPGATTPTQAAADPTGFLYLKRDLVRLLGILCNGTKVVQDRVRECGGLPVVMNLCVVDERNPYLREHAIFTLRNLLIGNEESQAVVDAIKPGGSWDEDGVLQNDPDAIRK